MAHVRDIAAYILASRHKAGERRVSAMKLQKLCYYAYGYHLVWEERQQFPEPFEAWANGPVCPALYDLHRGRFLLSQGEIGGEPGLLDEGERESVDLVLATYGPLSAHHLSAMTHAAGPWVQARDRAGAAPLERSSERLHDDEIGEFFDALISADAGQER